MNDITPRLIEFRNNKIISIVDSERNTIGYVAERQYFKELGEKKIGGNINTVARRKIERRFEAWYEMLKIYNSYLTKYDAKRKLKFVLITLTLPVEQFHSDKYLKLKLLKPFIKKIELDYQAHRWMWRAEKQKNGNIHFHIAIDKYIDKNILNDIYLHYLKSLGYLQIYQQSHPGQNPPALNVTGQKHMYNPVSYLTKYLSKNAGYDCVDGANWRMSNMLVNMKPFQFYDIDNFENRLRQLVDSKQATIFEDDFFTVYHAKRQTTEKLLSEHIKELKINYYLNLSKQYIVKSKPTYATAPEKTFERMKEKEKLILKLDKQLDLFFHS
jgi:hypothetical protein